jgi:hypothetical protein
MRRFRSGIAGIALAGVLGGCGGSTVDEGPKEFRPTDTKAMEPLFKEMQNTMKNKSYLKKPEPEKPKEAEKKK